MQSNENQQDLVKFIYNPGWTYQMDTYRIEIVEMLADNYQAFANVKFSSLSTDTVVRPFLCAEDGRYYISPEECKREVFFFEYVFYPINRPPKLSNFSFGVSLSGTEMNDVNTWRYSGTANHFRYNDSEMTFVFDMKIGRYVNNELVIERVTCEVTCPVLPTLDICYFEASNCIAPEFYLTNTQDPDFVFVLTPLTCMLSYDADHDTPWDRELDELAVEWGGHALFFWADQSARDIDFDNAEANKSHFYFVKKAIKRGWGKVVGE